MDPFDALEKSTVDRTGDPFEALERPAEYAVPKYVDEQFRRERTWGEVEPELKAGGIDPEPYRQNYQLQEARKMQSGEGIGVAEAFTRSSIPFGSSIYKSREAQKYTDALERFKGGKASGDDALTIARFERLEQLDAERNSTMGGKLVDLLGSVPAVAGEFYAGGKVVGAIGKAAGIGQAASTAGRLGQFAGRQAAVTPLVPSLYLDQAAKRNIDAGRDALDIRGFPTSLGMAYAQNLVLGSLTRRGPIENVTGKVPTLAGRSLARGAVGTAEMAGVDAAAGFADEFLADQYKTGTKYGLFGALKRGEVTKALEDATVSTLGFALFAALHDRARAEPLAEVKTAEPRMLGSWNGQARSIPGKPEPPPGESRSRERPSTPNADAIMRAYWQGVEGMKRQGFNPSSIANEITRIRGQFEELLKRDPNATAADARGLFDRERRGPFTEFARKMADSFPKDRPVTPAKPEPRTVEAEVERPPEMDTVSNLLANRPNPAQSTGVTSTQVDRGVAPAPSQPAPPAENRPGSPVAAPPAGPTEPPAAGGSKLGGFVGELMNRFLNRGREPQKAPEPPPLKRGKVKERRELQRSLDVDRADRLMEGAALQAAIRRSQTNPASAADPRQKLLRGASAGGMVERVWNARVPQIRTAVGEAVDNPNPENIERARGSVESLRRLATARGMDPQKAVDQELPRWAAFEAEQDLKAAVASPENVPGPPVEAAQQEVNSEIARQLSAGRRQGKNAAAVRSEIESVIREADAAADREGAVEEAESPRQPAGRIGFETTIAVPGSASGIRSHYELRELDDVIASHKADPPHNLLDRVKAGEYPAGVQPRDYGIAGEVNKVWDNARAMVPGFFISNHPSATNGPPTIDPSGRVINGNGRQMSIEASTHVGTYERYRVELERTAAVYGVDPATVKGMKRPALYRVVDFAIDSAEAREFARLGNVGETQAQSPVRAAAAMADMLTPEMIRAMDLRGDETFSKAVNGPGGTGFREKLYGRLPGPMRDTYFTADRTLTDAGQELVQNMMLSKVLPVEMIEELAADHKRLFQSIEGVVPALMKVATNPELDNVNVAPQLEEALGFLLDNPRVQSAADASNALDQLDLFTGKKAAELSPGGRMMLDFLLEAGGKPRTFHEGITKIIAGERGASGLFDDPNARLDIVSNAGRLMGVKERPGAKFGGPRGRRGAITLPTWADLKDSNLAKGIVAARDAWGKLGGEMFPSVKRISEPVADRMSTLVAANAFSEAATKYVMSAVFGNLNKESQAKFYTAHLETRLAYMQSRGLNAGSVIGPDSPVKDMAEYRRIVTSPAFRRYLERWKNVMVPIMDKHFRDSKGMPANAPILSATQIPGYPINFVKVWEDGSLAIDGAAGGTRIHPERVTQRRFKFSRTATGESEYETDPAKALGAVLEHGSAAASRANLDREIVTQGVGMWSRPGQPAPVTRDGRTMKAVRHVDPEQGTQAAMPGQGTLYVDPRMLEEYHNAIGIGNKFRITGVTPALNVVNRLALMSTVELAYHSANLMMQLGKPRVVRNLIREVGQFVKPMLRGKLPGLNDAQLERLMNLAEGGSTKAAGFQSGFLFGEKFAEKHPTLTKYLDFTRWGSHILDSVDSLMRLASDAAFESLKKSGRVDPSPSNKRDFLNALGNYLKDSQALLIRALRGSGFGPFATAGANTPIHSIRSLWLSSGLKATNLKNAVILRAHVGAKIAAAIGGVMLLNWLAWGRVDGDETVPFGALKVFEYEGRSYFLDPLRFLGPRRGMRITGIEAAVEGERLGASDESVIHKARKDVQHAVLHPASGPAVGMMTTMATGANTMGTNLAGAPDPAGNAIQRTQEWENFKAALKNINPSLAQLIGADRVRPGEAMPLFPLTGKGQGVIGDMPEGESAGGNALKLAAPYLQSRKILGAERLRGFMEEEARPKREVPLRRR